MPRQQHPSLARHFLQAKAKGATPPRCFLTLKCTTICGDGHVRGVPSDNHSLALSLQWTPQSQPMRQRVRVGGEAEDLSEVLLPRDLHLARLRQAAGGRLHVLQG